MSSRNSLKIRDYHMNFVNPHDYKNLSLHTENLPRSPTFTLYSLILEHYQVYK